MDGVWINGVGALAATLTTVAVFPQAIKTLRSRETNGLSLAMYVLMVSGVVFWLVYGLILGSWPLIVANAVALIPQTAILTTLVRQRAEAGDKA